MKNEDEKKAEYLKILIPTSEAQMKKEIQEKENQMVFGNWEVEKDGSLFHKKKEYFIDKNRLNEEDWIIHLQAKGWMDWNEFIPAYIKALQIAKIQFVKIQAYY